MLNMKILFSKNRLGTKKYMQLGDNCIQNFHLGRYIIGYAVENLVLWRCASGVVISKRISDDIPP